MGTPCVVVAAVLSLASAGCASTSGGAGNPVLDKDPYEVTCGDLENGGAPNVAAKVADEVVAPGQSREQTKDIISTAVAATCSQSNIPGVDDPRDYQPVGPVVEGVQHGIDDPTGESG